LLLEDILERIERILRFTRDRDLAAFRTDEQLTDAVIRNLEVIGEAAWRLPKTFTTDHAEIPWPLIVGLRHRIVHEYFDVDVDLVWEIVARELLPLRDALGKLLSELSS
jgi:uncharacterized protein with HEPN domain